MLALLPEYVDPYNNLPKMQYYQEYLKNVSEFVKKNPDEFDIITVAELITKANEALTKKLNVGNDKSSKINNDLNNAMKNMFIFTDKSNKFLDFEDLYYEYKLNEAITKLDDTFKLLEDNILKIEKFLLNNTPNNKYYSKAIELGKESKKFFETPENAKQIDNINKLVKELLNQDVRMKKSIINAKLQIKILEEYLQENIINKSSAKVIDKIKKLKLEVKNQDNSLLYIQKNFAENFINNLPEEIKKIAADERKEKIKKDKEEYIKKKEEKKILNRNIDDVSQSKIGKEIIKYQDPTCGNLTLSDVLKNKIIHRKWIDVQDFNNMNAQIAKVTGILAVDVYDGSTFKRNDEISVVFIKKMGGLGSWDLYGRQSDLDFAENLEFTFVLGTWIMETCSR